ncbi:MAG: Gfo/Idh/MocA family protein [Opitutales bacterium]
MTRARLGLIGVTQYGSLHLRLVREQVAAGRAQACAATIINPEEAPDAVAWLEANGARIYSHYRDMLEGERGRLDLVLVPTPIPWHAPMTCDALEAGANVLVEKPLAGSVAEVARIRDTEARTGRFVAVGFQDIYAPVVQALKRRILDGAIGRLVRIRSLGLWPRDSGYYARNNWAGRLETPDGPVLDSPFNNAMAHFLNLALFLAGERFNQSATLSDLQAELYRARPIESFDTGCLRAHGPGGVEIVFLGSHSTAERQDVVLTVEGETGTAYWEHTGATWIESADGEREAFDPVDQQALRSTMMEAVMRRLMEPEAFICTAALAERHTALIAALHRNFPIHSIPDAHIALQPREDGNQQPVVDGLDAALNAACREGCLLAELAAPPAWSCPQAPVLLEG